MDFKVFDDSEIKKYKEETKAKWGATKEYQEYEQRQQKNDVQDYRNKSLEMMKLFKEIGKLRHLPPADIAVQEKIAALQSFITDNYYTCNKEVLSGLGQMYTADERFKINIDEAGGEGTAEFVNKAISVYCSD